jgi:hypothetical protein
MSSASARISSDDNGGIFSAAGWIGNWSRQDFGLVGLVGIGLAPDRSRG